MSARLNAFWRMECAILLSGQTLCGIFLIAKDLVP
jgi:hypothetical protein